MSLIHGLVTVFALMTVSTLSFGQSSLDIPQLPEKADVRVIVDISGSMKINDPDNLRQPAIRLIARLLPEGTSAGIWTFGQYVNMLVPHGKVDDVWRARAIERSSEINSVALRTNLGKALEVASDGYFTDGDLTNTQFILLTDGKVDISSDDTANEIERARVLGAQLDQLRAEGARVHTVALSEDADLDFLTTLAVATDGSRSVAETADKLSRVFITALNTAVPQEQVPIKDNGFRVDSGVKEFTALIFTGKSGGGATTVPGLKLTQPNGQAIGRDSKPDNVRWVSEPDYDLITVDQPDPGQWLIDGALGEGSRITVVSDLKMVVGEVPARFYLGQPVDISAAFYEDKSQITDPDFLNVIEVSLMLTADDGRMGTKVLSGNRPPEDGVYRDVIQRLEEFGDYTLDLVADGQTFSRKFTRIIALRPPIRVVMDARGVDDSAQYEVLVKPEHPQLNPAQSGVTMQVAFEGELVASTSLAFSAHNNEWQAAIAPEQGDGLYTVTLAFNGETMDGKPVIYKPESFTARFPRSPGDQNVRTSPVAAREPAPEPQSPADSAPDVQPEEAEPAPIENPAVAPVMPENGPIDISQVELPVEPESQESEPEPLAPEAPDSDWTAWLVGGAAGLVVLPASVLLWWRKRRSTDSVETDELQTDDSEPEPEPEPEPELESASATEINEEPGDEEDEDGTPSQLEPEPDEAQAQAQGEEAPGQSSEEPNAEADETDNDEYFGLEDFDLSDIDDLPDLEDDSPEGDGDSNDPDDHNKG